MDTPSAPAALFSLNGRVIASTVPLAGQYFLQGSAVVYATADWVCVDEFVTRTMRRAEPRRVFNIAVRDLKLVDVEGTQQAGKVWDGWRLSTGFFHGARQVAATTALAFVLTNDQYLVFEVTGMPPIVVRQAVAPLVNRIAQSAGMPPFPSPEEPA